MLFERLREYALQQMDIPPPGYQEQAIRYIVRLREDGRYIGLEDTYKGPKDRGTKHLAPYVKRTVGVKAKLLADTGEYALGIPRNDPKKPADPKRVAQQHAAFGHLVRECAAATGEPSVDAVATFLEQPLPDDPVLGTSFDASATVSFRVNAAGIPEGVMPVDLPSVRAFWAARFDAGEAVGANAMTCFICGRTGPVLERHPLKIKGIPGGQIQKDLISANAGAFESYGLKASQIAPTCQECAEAYGNALNDLLAKETSHLWTKELAYAFWTEKKEETFGSRAFGLITKPEANPAEVGELLKAYWSGNTHALAIDDTRFYTVALGASGARVVVSDWLDTTVGHAKASLGRYFALQELVDAWGQPAPPLPLFRLTGSTVFRGATPPPLVGRSLVRTAIRGGPLPLDILFMAVKRNRAEQQVTRERAALIKMVLASQSSREAEEATRMTSLDLASTEPAYLCGRLLATLDNIQRVALNLRNATIIDKYYGTASSAPAAVFGTLLHGAQSHLGKMRRDNPGAHYRLEAQLETIMAPLQAFPATLTLPEQGLFALGFYHQRAADRAAIQARKAAGKADATDAVLDTADPAPDAPEGED